MKTPLFLLGMLAVSACAANGGDSNSGTGGASSGAGGSTSAGGSAQTGGRLGSGGASASGGSSASGGASVSGGASGTGGTSASGGTGTAGSTGSGGKTGSGGSTGSGGAGGARDGGVADTGSCTDSCPAPKGGLTIGCKKRFLYGANFAWKNFSCDFGGKTTWGFKGVAADKAAYMTAIQEMKDNGVDVIRWWMFPNLTGDGIALDSTTSRTPTGLGTTVLDDVRAALDIAASLNVHIKLTLFSFDNFKPDSADAPSTGPIVTDATKRAALIAKVVRPIAAAVEASPNKDRMIAWDAINEPEWAITTGTDPYGDPAFDGQSTLQTITFAQMETFVKDVITGLHAESRAPVTVGSAAVKWANAWSKVGVDYHDFHWYGWVDQYFAHTKTPTDYKVDDKPVVIGEFPFNPGADTTGTSFGGISYATFVTDVLNAGYAGAMGWAYSDTMGPFNWATAKSNVKAWADSHTCYTHF